MNEQTFHGALFAFVIGTVFGVYTGDIRHFAVGAVISAALLAGGVFSAKKGVK